MHIKHSNQKALPANMPLMFLRMGDQPIANVGGIKSYLNPNTVFKVVKYRRIIKP